MKIGLFAAAVSLAAPISAWAYPNCGNALLVGAMSEEDARTYRDGGEIPESRWLQYRVRASILCAEAIRESEPACEKPGSCAAEADAMLAAERRAHPREYYRALGWWRRE